MMVCKPKFGHFPGFFQVYPWTRTSRAMPWGRTHPDMGWGRDTGLEEALLWLNASRQLVPSSGGRGSDLGWAITRKTCAEDGAMRGAAVFY